MTRYRATADGQIPFTPEEEVARDAEEAAWAASANDRAAAEYRMQRNTLLLESDWTQVADAPVDQAAWAVYRQALRDISQQAGFPATVVWPVKP
jgi:hypothetical protein